MIAFLPFVKTTFKFKVEKDAARYFSLRSFSSKR
jgi:hypothetical protein